MTSKLRLAAVAAAALCARCGSPTTPTPPPPVSEIVLTCPTDVRIGSVATPTMAVSFPDPTATGGTPPIRITCSPAAGADFPLGTTAVSCTGTDGVRIATCSFKVTLVPPQPNLSVSNVIAFGDSITAGENGEGSLLFIDGANSYPMQLLGLLQLRYTTQSPVVHNCGLPGETAQDGAGRIDPVLDFYRAEVLLLLEGVNSLTGDFRKDSAIVQGALAHDITAARSRGMAAVFLSTLLPVFPGNCTPATPTCRGSAHDNGEITAINGVIAGLAAQPTVTLVDNYAKFVGHPEYADSDGLHLLPLGNRVLAQSFFSAIQTRFEFLTPTVASGWLTRSALATSPRCPYDGQTAVTLSSGR